jgi:solute:Na+ symporter, SSS family
MHWIDISIVVIYLSIIVAIGLYLQKKASSDIDSFFLGGRKLPWWVLGSSGMASNLDVTGTMINTALLFSLGVGGFFVEIRGGVVLILGFLMIFLGKWYRRSQVMTLAEWMTLRFGTGRAGTFARLVTAGTTIIFVMFTVSYFCKGAGKFVAEFLGIPALMGMPPDFWAAIIMISLATLYTVASGIQGVVWTDLFQSVFIFITIISVSFICFTRYEVPERFQLSAPVNEQLLAEHNKANPDSKLGPGSKLGDNKEFEIKQVDGKNYVFWETTREHWSQAWPHTRMKFPDISDYSMFNMLLLCIFFYLMQTMLRGSGAIEGYMAQRYFSAASDRDAGLLTLFWTVLLAFRWPLIVSLSIMGISLTASGQLGDPEMVLPAVVNNLIPVGLKGLLVAGLMAASMSTFDSMINATAAYWVKDIYQPHIRPRASQKKLMQQGRLASVAVVLAGLAFSLTIRNINEIWGWLMMGLGAGWIVPLVVRWYWWRLNGWGYGFGVLAGIISAGIGQALLPEGSPEYVIFLIVVGSSLAALVLGTLLTKATDIETLKNFYLKTRPFGFWSRVRSGLPSDILDSIRRENRRDIFSVFIAIPWQLFLFLTLIMVMMKRWDNVAVLLLLLTTCSVILYFSWFRNLDSE